MTEVAKIAQVPEKKIAPALSERYKSVATPSLNIFTNREHELLSVKYRSTLTSLEYEIFLPDTDIEVLSRYVIISPIKKCTTKTRGGIIQLSQEKEQYTAMVGMILAKGDRFYNLPGFKGAKEPQVGDVVLYQKYGGVIFPFKGQQFRLERDTDSFVVIDDPMDYEEFPEETQTY